MQVYTPTTAKKALEANPKLRAAVLEGSDTPLMDHETTEVRLFERVKAADAYLRDRKEEIEVLEGAEAVSGTLARGVFQFKSGFVLALDKKKVS